MIIDLNIVALLTIIVGIIALFFFILDKYPMETVSIGLLSSLALIQIIFSKHSGFDITNLLSGFANPGLITVIALLLWQKEWLLPEQLALLQKYLN